MNKIGQLLERLKDVCGCGAKSMNEFMTEHISGTDDIAQISPSRILNEDIVYVFLRFFSSTVRPFHFVPMDVRDMLCQKEKNRMTKTG